MLAHFFSKLAHSGALKEGDREVLSHLCSDVREFGARKYILRVGENPENLPVILSGWAAQFRLLGTGARQITGLLIPGDHIDYNLQMTTEPEDAVRSLTPCTVAYLNRSLLEEAIANRKGLQRAFSWCTLLEESILRAWIVNLGAREGYPRIAHLMCEMWTRMKMVGLGQAAGPGARLPFPLTQDEIADAAGMTSVHANRVLQRMRREGLLDLSNKQLHIISLESLCEIAGFDPTYLHLDFAETFWEGLGAHMRSEVETAST